MKIERLNKTEIVDYCKSIKIETECKKKNCSYGRSSFPLYGFTILPFWYSSTWAMVGYFILLAILIWGIVRLSVKRSLKQNEYIEKVVEKRTTELRSKNVKLKQQIEEILAQQNEKNK